jgi:hypothetical protein
MCQSLWRVSESSYGDLALLWTTGRCIGLVDREVILDDEQLPVATRNFSLFAVVPLVN